MNIWAGITSFLVVIGVVAFVILFCMWVDGRLHWPFDYHRKLARLTKKMKRIELKRNLVREKMDSKNRRQLIKETARGKAKL